MSFDPDRTSPRGKGVRQPEAYLNKVRIGYCSDVFGRQVITLAVAADEVNHHRRRWLTDTNCKLLTKTITRVFLSGQVEQVVEADDRKRISKQRQQVDGGGWSTPTGLIDHQLQRLRCGNRVGRAFTGLAAKLDLNARAFNVNVWSTVTIPFAGTTDRFASDQIRLS